MNKAGVIVIAALFTSLASLAQQGGCNLAVRNTQAFMKTKAMVLLLGDKAYNEAITQAFKENWKVTPFDFAPASDIANYISSPEYSVVLPVFDLNTTLIAVLKGGKGKKGVSNYNSESMVAYADIDGLAFEPSMSDALYRISHMIKSMDNYIREVHEENIGVSSCDLIRSSTAKYYNRKAFDMKGKVLLIDSRYVLKTDIDAAYPYGYKIVDKSVIEDAVRNKKKGFCYLASRYVFDTQTGEVLHMSFESPPTNKLTKGFFKELVTNMNQ